MRQWRVRNKGGGRELEGEEAPTKCRFCSRHLVNRCEAAQKSKLSFLSGEIYWNRPAPKSVSRIAVVASSWISVVIQTTAKNPPYTLSFNPKFLPKKGNGPQNIWNHCGVIIVNGEARSCWSKRCH